MTTVTVTLMPFRVLNNKMYAAKNNFSEGIGTRNSYG